jgi:hypothetical protein
VAWVCEWTIPTERPPLLKDKVNNNNNNNNKNKNGSCAWLIKYYATKAYVGVDV